MKKVFFTAIALVAFSGVSMANVATENLTKNKEIVVLDRGDKCQEFAMDFMEEWDADGTADIVSFNNAFQEVLNWCYSQQ